MNEPNGRIFKNDHLKKMRTPIIILFLTSLLATSCGKPPIPPTDEEMIRHFNAHEATFKKIYEIIANSSEGSFHYPPLFPDEIIISDSAGQQSDISGKSDNEQDTPIYGLLMPDRMQLDSLLAEIGCGFILVDRQEQKMTDSIKLNLVIPYYYSNGLAISGTSKKFLYNPDLRNHRIRFTEHGDLNEICRRTYCDTTLYKPIKGNWYIKLDHER